MTTESADSGCGVRVSFEEDFISKRYLGLACNFVAVYLTSVQFISELKLCLYTIMHLLL